MKKFQLTLLTLAFGGIVSFAQSADDILNKHIEAMGGAKWKTIKTVKLTGVMSQGGVDITMSETIKNNEWSRTDISAAGQSGYVLVTQKEGWMYMPFLGQTKPEAMSAEDVSLSKDKLNYSYQLLVDKGGIKSSTMAGKDSVDSKPCFKLKIKTTDGNEISAFFDCKTYFLSKVSTMVKVEGTEQEVAVTYGDYKKQPEGVFIPMTMGTTQGDLHFTAVELNKPYGDEYLKHETN